MTVGNNISATQILTEINANLPDNFAEQITPAVVRQILADISASYVNNLSNTTAVAQFLTTAPATLSGTSGTLSSTSTIINPSGTFTLTLPSPTGNAGQWLWIKSVAAQIVNSASSNVVPLGSTVSGTTVFSATQGKFGALQSDGINWIIMMGN